MEKENSAKEMENAEFNSLRWIISVGYRNLSPGDDPGTGTPGFSAIFHNIEGPRNPALLPLSDHLQQQLEDILGGIQGETDYYE